MYTFKKLTLIYRINRIRSKRKTEMKVISNINKFLIAAFIVLLPVFSFSAEKNKDSASLKPVKKPILIFNFTSAGSEENEYYSYIIPDSITKNIASSPKFNIKKINITPEFKDSPQLYKDQKKDISGHWKSDKDGTKKEMTEKEMKEYLKNLRKTVKEKENSDQKADYIITGSFEVNDENQIRIKIRIFDLEGRTADFIVFQDSTNQAIFTGTIDEITSKIYEKISEFEKSREKTAKSPFLPLYKISSIFSFGFESGYIFILQPWTGIYTDPAYVRPNITAHIGNYFGISANILYFNLNTISLIGNSMDMTVWAPSVDLHFFLNLAKYFHLSVSAGGGFAYSHITMYNRNNGPYSNPIVDASSFDAYLDASLCIGVNLGPVTLRAGSSYKLILFMNNPMHMISVFGGFQYRI